MYFLRKPLWFECSCGSLRIKEGDIYNIIGFLIRTFITLLLHCNFTWEERSLLTQLFIYLKGTTFKGTPLPLICFVLNNKQYCMIVLSFLHYNFSLKNFNFVKDPILYPLKDHRNIQIQMFLWGLNNMIFKFFLVYLFVF